MRWLRDHSFIVLVLTTCHAAVTEITKKPVENIKRAEGAYLYTGSTPEFEDNLGNAKTKVIVETIKSISPSEYLSSDGFFESGFETNTPASKKTPIGSISFNAFDADSTKVNTFVTSVPTEPTTPSKKKSSYRYYTGIASNNNNSSSSSHKSTQAYTTNLPVSTGVTGAEIITTSLPANQFSSHTSSDSGDYATSSKASKSSTSRGKSRQSSQKIIKKSFKLEPRIFDSKPEETGGNGYHYGIGSLNFESKYSNSQSGGSMMGLSYMRASSPFYNFHVMLD